MNRNFTTRLSTYARLTALLFYAGCILWLSLSPNPPTLSAPLLSWDKLQHAGAYALLTLLTGHFIAGWRPAIHRPWLWALLATVVFGGMVEILQGAMTSGRHAEWMDLLADAAGGVAGVAGMHLLEQAERWLSKRNRQ